MIIKAQDVLSVADAVASPVDLDSALSLTLDEAMSIALGKAVNGVLSEDWYIQIMSKLGEAERTTFTLGIASEGIKVVKPEAIPTITAQNKSVQVIDKTKNMNNIIETVDGEDKFDELQKKYSDKSKFTVQVVDNMTKKVTKSADQALAICHKIMQSFNIRGYLAEDDYCDWCVDESGEVVGAVNDFIARNRIPLRKNKPRLNKYKKDVVNKVKHPDINDIKAYADTIRGSNMKRSSNMNRVSQHLEQEQRELEDVVRKRRDQLPNWRDLLKRVRQALSISDIREIWDDVKNLPAFACEEFEHQASLDRFADGDDSDDSDDAAVIAENYINGNMSDVKSIFKVLSPFEAIALALEVQDYLSEMGNYSEAKKFLRFLARG